MTPAESLAGKQAEQLREYLHSIGKHDEAYKVPTYLTNSFHCHVSEEITPFEKQDHEFELFHMIEGGHWPISAIVEQSTLKNAPKRRNTNCGQLRAKQNA